MSRNTGLLTERCDPYGAESQIKLMGGMIPENMVGRYHWFCREPAAGRFRLICKGGEYGFRRANDGGLVEAYICPGGHQGVVMPLCKTHQRELTVGPPQPGFRKDYTPYGQVGGTVANKLCPPCTFGRGTDFEGQIRGLMERGEALQAEISKWQSLGLMVMPMALIAEQDQVRAELDEYHERGVIHQCPLILREVS